MSLEYWLQEFSHHLHFSMPPIKLCTVSQEKQASQLHSLLMVTLNDSLHHLVALFILQKNYEAILLVFLHCIQIDSQLCIVQFSNRILVYQ